MDFKQWARPAEQFCVFVFDFADNNPCIFPPLSGFTRDIVARDYHMQEWSATWMAAFWTVCQPDHTEKFIFDNFEQWVHNYSVLYGHPRALYIYSRYIPCMRDGDAGTCGAAIATYAELLHERYGVTDLYVGWSNNGFNVEDAIAGADAMADAGEGGGPTIHLYPDVSIAGNTL
jgi:hypothetical protein